MKLYDYASKSQVFHQSSKNDEHRPFHIQSKCGFNQLPYLTRITDELNNFVGWCDIKCIPHLSLDKLFHKAVIDAKFSQRRKMLSRSNIEIFMSYRKRGSPIVRRPHGIHWSIQIISALDKTPRHPKKMSSNYPKQKKWDDLRNKANKKSKAQVIALRKHRTLMIKRRKAFIQFIRLAKNRGL